MQYFSILCSLTWRITQSNYTFLKPNGLWGGFPTEEGSQLWDLKVISTNISPHSVITLTTMFYALIYLLSKHRTEEPAVLLIISFTALKVRSSNAAGWLLRNTYFLNLYFTFIKVKTDSLLAEFHHEVSWSHNSTPGLRYWLRNILTWPLLTVLIFSC